VRPRAGSRAGRGGSAPRKATAKALAREEEIYRAAAEIFHRKGYAATSLQDIADEVGILKGSLYYYIDSKEDLLYGITKAIHDDSMTILREVQALDASPAGKLRALLERHVAVFARNLSMVRVFYIEYDALKGARKKPIMRDRHAYEQLVFSLIEQGQAQGELCPDLDARIACNAVLTMVNTIYMWYRPESGIDISDVVATYRELAMRGLVCPAGHDHPPTGRRARRSAARQ
jgi:AcrR family transcriptional regulator